MNNQIQKDGLIPAKRRDTIFSIIQEKKIVSIGELSKQFNVTEMTIRRDLEVMEKDGLLERTHGGALISDHISLEPLYAQKSQKNKIKKEAIGRLVATLIDEDDTVFVNSGSTTLQFLRFVSKERVKIITNNAKAPSETLSEKVKVIMIGGELRRESFSLVGETAFRTVREVYGSKAVIGVDGFSLTHGLTTPVYAEAMLNNLMIKQTTGLVIVVADSSKIGKVSNFLTSEIDKVTDLVTDSDLDEMYVCKIRNMGIRVHIADISDLS